MHTRLTPAANKAKNRNKIKLAFDLLKEEMQILPHSEMASINGGIDTLRINGGTLYSDNGGTTFLGDNGTVVYFSGVSISTSMVASGTAYQMDGTIHIDEGWASGGFNLNDFAHEYGHYMQQQHYGAYYAVIAAMSAYDAYTDPSNHQSQWYEVEASSWGNNYVSLNSSSYPAYGPY